MARSPPLRLYVWGPAFGLASLDAECLAAIAYFRHHAAEQSGRASWELVASSPSAVPTNHLPALHDPASGKWASGYEGVVNLLRTTETTTTTTTTRYNEDTALSTFLHLHAPPLLSLSLYVSSANYASATRPALSRLLPFPLGWTEPSARRRFMARRAEHLGLSAALDTDRDDGEKGAEVSSDRAGESFIPRRLRPRAVGSSGVSAALTGEARARFRLEVVVGEVLDVVLERAAGGGGDGDSEDDGCMRGPWGGGDDEKSKKKPSRLECLAFGYLALMVVPELPRPWLRDIVTQKYGVLAEFVDDARVAWFGPLLSGPASSASSVPDGFGSGSGFGLPWVVDVDGASPAARAARLATAAIAALPGGVGEGWAVWMRRRRQQHQQVQKEQQQQQLGAGKAVVRRTTAVDTELVLAACSGILGGGAIAAVGMLFRGLQPFGMSVQRFEREPVAAVVGVFGAAGAALGLGGMAPEWDGLL